MSDSGIATGMTPPAVATDLLVARWYEVQKKRQPVTRETPIELFSETQVDPATLVIAWITAASDTWLLRLEALNEIMSSRRRVWVSPGEYAELEKTLQELETLWDSAIVKAQLDAIWAEHGASGFVLDISSWWHLRLRATTNSVSPRPIKLPLSGDEIISAKRFIAAVSKALGAKNRQEAVH